MPDVVTAHCLRCAGERPVKDVRRVRLVNNKIVERATCVTCGCATSRFVKEKA